MNTRIDRPQNANTTAHEATHSVRVGDSTVPVTLTERGQGHPILLLHGGGGPLTMSRWGDRLAEVRHARVLTPTHPGFGGTPRPDSLSSIRDLAALYVALLEELDLRDVSVVGNSIGGWIATEMAVLGAERISSYVLVDGVGIKVAGHPVADFFSLTPAEVAQRSYADPDTHGVDPSSLPPEVQRVLAGNRAALEVYGGRTMTDPTLAGRLTGVDSPVLVVWGEADRIGDPAYGQAYADAVPGARFELMREAGHLPQIEQPDALIDIVWAFADSSGAAATVPAPETSM